jgi:integrase
LTIVTNNVTILPEEEKMSVILREKIGIGKKKKNSLYLEINRDGKREYRFLKLYFDPKNKLDRDETRDKGEEIRRIWAKSIRDTGTTPNGETEKRTDFVQFFRDLAEGQDNPRTRVSWMSVLRHLEEFTGGSVQLQNIDEAWINRLWKSFKKGHKPNTAWVYATKIRHALYEAKWEELPGKGKLSAIKNPKKVKTLHEYLTGEEVAKLAVTPIKDERVKRAFLFSVLTGLRPSDVRLLEWGWIDGNRLTIKAMEKTDEPLKIDLAASAMDILASIKNDLPDNIVVHPTQKIFILPHETTVNRNIKNWYRLAGIGKHIVYRTSRHTAGTWVGERLGPLAVKQLLGHTDIATSMIYISDTDAMRKRVAESMPEIKIKS